MFAAAALLLIALAMAALTTGSRLRRGLGLAVGACAFTTPLLAPQAPEIGRAAIALTSVWLFARTIDLVRDPRSWSLTQRLCLAFAIFDSREARRTTPAFDARALLGLAAYGGFGVCSLLLATIYADQLEGPARWAVRWTAGTGFVYAFPDAVAAAYRVVFGLVGVRIPEMHRAPILSRSLTEFWGQRWNRIVGAWLRRHCFLPFARRRQPGRGLLLAFVASTALHAWFAGVAVGWVAALAMGSYFLIQGALVAVEQRVRPGELGGRTWALLGAGLPAPLFVEPMLWIFEPTVAQLRPVLAGLA